VYQQTTETSGRDTGRLQDEQITEYLSVLTFGQMVYGQWNYQKELQAEKRTLYCD
jgi:hypothetical protein